MATYTKKAVRGTLIASVGSIIASILAYFTHIVLARNLLPEEYGLFFAVWTFVAFFLFFTDFGITSAVVKYIAEYRSKRKFNQIKTTIFSAFIIILTSTSIFAAILLILSKFLAISYFRNSASLILIYLFVAYIYLSAVAEILRAIFRGFQKMFIFSAIEPLKNLVILTSTILLLNANLKVLAPTFAYMLGWVAVLALFPMVFRIFNLFRYRIKNLLGSIKRLICFGLPVLFAGIGEKVIGYIDTLMLTYITTLTEVGIYNVILPSALLFMFLANSLADIALPVTSELWAKKDKTKISDGLQLFYKYSFLFLIPVIFTIFVFAKMFITLFFGESYAVGALAFQILLIGVFLYIVAKINNTILVGMGKPNEITKIIFSAAITNVIVNIILIPLYGIVGAAIATSVSYFIVFVLSLMKIRKYVKIRIPAKVWIKTFILGIIFVFVIQYITHAVIMNKWIEIIVSVTISWIVYFALSFFLKLIDVQEIKKYMRLAK